MQTIKPHLSLTVMSLAILCSPATLAAGTPCQDSASLMAQSCYSESNEEYTSTVARCNSFNYPTQRGNCNARANAELEQARATCGEQRTARAQVCNALGELRYQDPLSKPDIDFINPDDIGPGGYDNNPYVILETGHTHLLRSEEYDEEENETTIELIVVHVTDEVREIKGVDCRVVVDVVVEPEYDEDEGKYEFTAIEVTDDWFAQDVDANVYYCGEIARNFEDGILRDLDGSFEAGVELAEGGDLTRAVPTPGDTHRQEYALGEAEDIVEYLGLDADPADKGISEDMLDIAYRCTTGDNSCLMTYDYSPLEPSSAEFKYYLAGTGFVLAVPIEDGEINAANTEWLVCEGDSYAALDNCGIEDEFGEGSLDELKGALCDLADELCDDGEN